MKITIYTIKDCAFSKQEKEYLNANKLTFEEKDLETNKDFLTEMLAISNNFAGTPVTRVEKDDGTIAVLKGFTKEEFDTTFGFTSAPVSTDSETQSVGQPIPTDSTVLPPVNDTPLATPPPSAEPITPPVEPVSAAPISPPMDAPVSEPSNQVTNNQASVSPDPLKSVMDDLQSKAQPSNLPPEAPVVTEPTPPTPPMSQPVTPTTPGSENPIPTTGMPNIPEPDFK